jgi:hypothetical protein
MPNDDANQTLTSYTRKLVLFFIVLGETFLIVWLFKWLLHANAKIYLFLIPCAVLLWINVFRPAWIARATQLLELDSDRFNKWNPPGFP